MCLGPLTGYYSKVLNPSGKRSLVFKVSDAFSPIPVEVPCGKCVECRLANAGQKAVRLMNELRHGYFDKKLGAVRQHDVSSFLTLTYDPEHVPEGNTLVKDDASAFHKRLHNRLLRSRGYGIRYFCSGEYGETNGRPHYHSIVFGWRPTDLRFYKNNKRSSQM